MYFVSSDHCDQIFMRSNLQFFLRLLLISVHFSSVLFSPGSVEADVG